MKKITLSLILMLGVMVASTGLVAAAFGNLDRHAGVDFISPALNEYVAEDYLVEWINVGSFPDMTLQVKPGQCTEVGNWIDLKSFPSTTLSYLWDTDDLSFLINYEHSFSKFTGYVMAYYSPVMGQNIFSKRYTRNFSGPGIRLMAVFNH